MKKIIGVGVGEGRTRTAGRLAGVRTAAVAGCLMLLAGWTGAYAQKNFDVNHATDGITGWTKSGSGTEWEVREGAAVPRKGSGAQNVSFLINNHDCQSDGVYEAAFTRANDQDDNNKQSPSMSGGLIFRYKSPNEFYYLMLAATGWGANWMVALYKNNVAYTGDSNVPNNSSGENAYRNLTGFVDLARGGNSDNEALDYGSKGEYRIQVTLEGSRFIVKSLNLNKVIATFTDESIDKGRVGYAAKAVWNDNTFFIRYLSSSWEDKNAPPREVTPAGWYAWNTATSGASFPNFTADKGNWTDRNWTTTNASSQILWVAGKNALFSGAPEGAAGAYLITVPSAQTVGDMRFEINGYAIGGTAALTRSGGGSVFVESNKSAAINAVLSGGKLTKSGAGSLTLGAANTYTGGTAIDAGTVIAANATAFGADTVSLAAATTLQLNGVTLGNPFRITGGELTTNGASSISGNIALSASSAIPVNAAQNLTFSGVVSGSSQITKTGAGTLIFTGNSTNTGAITVSAGGLQLGTGGTSGIVAAPISIAGTTVTFNRSNAVTYSNNITGTGSLVKSGSGTLTLSGTNSYSGGTTINAGGITISSASNIGSGAITMEAAATLTFNYSGTAAESFNRAVSGGTGIFAKTGTGAVNLASAINVATVSIGAGTLNANTGASLKADSIWVASGATLGGTADIGNTTGNPTKIVVNGTISNTGTYWADGGMTLNAGTLKHDGAAPLSITGNLTMAGASTLDLPLTGLSTANKISVGGALSISDASYLNITGAIAVGTYKLISFGGAVTGNFGDRIKVGGAVNTDYLFSTKVNGKIVELTIAEKGGDSGAAKNYLTVDNAVASGNSVTLTIGGLTALKPFIGAANGARVMSVYVWYKPISAATVSPTGAVDTGATGGGVLIPLADIKSAAGNTMTFQLTVPPAKSATVDELYFFNVATFWSLDGASVIIPPSTTTTSKSAYLRDPKEAVKENGFTIGIDTVTVNTETALSFRVTVQGQNEASLRPGVAYKPSVDSVVIWSKRETPPTLAGNSPLNTARVPGSTNVWVFSLDSLRKNGTLNLSVGPVTGTRETVYFAVSPRWKGAGVDSLARELKFTSRSVNNSKVEAPNNPVSLTADQADRRSPSVSVTVGADGSFSAAATEVLVEASFSSSMADIINAKTLSVSDVSAGNTYVITDDGFVGAERVLYFKVTVKDAFGMVSDENRFDYTVGRKPPTPVAGLSAEPGSSGSMHLTWRAPTPAENNITDQNSAFLRIYYSENPIYADANMDNLDYKEASASESKASVDNLTPNTVYYFAAVLFDVVNPSKPDWTLRSLAATCSENTGSGNVVDNVLSIESAEFDDAAAAFRINVTLTENWPTDGDYKYVCLVTRDDGATVVLQSDPEAPGRVTANQSFEFHTEPLLGEALTFNTVYTIYVYMIDGEGNPSRRGTPAEVAVGDFKTQTVTVTIGGSGAVDNKNFVLGTAGWNTLGTPPYSFKAAVSVSEKGKSDEDGFIYIDNYGYSYTVSGNNDYMPLLGRFKVRLKAREMIPAPYTENDVRIYRWNDSGRYWEVVFNTEYDGEYFTGAAIDSVYRDNGSTYRLMINTRKPSITPPSEDEKYIKNGGSEINGSTTVSSNVGNFRVSMRVGPAKGAVELNQIAFTGPPQTGPDRSLTFEISRSVVQQSEYAGVLAFLIVDDGSDTTIANFSYKVTSDDNGGFPAAELRGKSKWSPFAVQATLVNKSVRAALKPALFNEDDPFVPHDTLYRLFRFVKNSWVEYNAENDSLFVMNPSQLMWFKTSAKGVSFDFGKATSIPLRETFEIELPSNQWTDLVLPFRFNVSLGDVLDSTDGARNNLEFYRWKGGDPKYVAELLNKPGAGSDTASLKGWDEPFTIYNKSGSPIKLRIPPMPATDLFKRKTSKAPALAKTAAGAQGAGDSWYYTLSSTVDGYELSDVLVGYYATNMTFAVPPSFSSESVVLVGDDGTETGHRFGPSIANGGTYKLRFYNDGGQRKEFKFSAKPSSNAPVAARVTFVRASTGEILNNGNGSTQSLTVAGMSHEDVFMIVGGNGYRAKAASVSAGAKFAVSKVIVNRAARSARINFYVPESGVNRVEMSVYDIKGRLIWTVSQNVKAASLNTIVWNSRSSKRGAASTGLYIARVKAIGANGRTVGADTKRIMFAR